MPTATACPIQEANLSNAVHGVEARVQELVNQIRAEAETDEKSLEDEAPRGPENSIGIDFKIEWVDKEFSLHIPTVTMHDQVIGSLHLPEIKMEDKDIVFHLPAIEMVNEVVGRHPNITCHGLRCTTTWSDIIISVPKTVQKEHRITLGTPTVTMKQQDITMGVPTFGTQLHTFVLSIPRITAVSISQASREMEDKTKEINDKYQAKSAELKNQIKQILIDNVVPPHNELFQCIRSGIETMRSATTTTFDQMLVPIQNSINELKAKNIPDDNEALKQLEAALSNTNSEKVSQLRVFDNLLANLDEQKRTSLEQITAQINQQ